MLARCGVFITAKLIISGLLLLLETCFVSLRWVGAQNAIKGMEFRKRWRKLGRESTGWLTKCDTEQLEYEVGRHSPHIHREATEA